MTDPADLTHGVLLRVAELLKGLPADQIAALAEGTAKLEVVPAAGRRSTGTARPAEPPTPLPVPAGQVRTELTKIGDRVAARRWLEDQGLKAAQLRTLAKELGISVPSGATKPVVLDQIVQWTIGRRLDSEAISRPAPARF